MADFLIGNAKGIPGTFLIPLHGNWPAPDPDWRPNDLLINLDQGSSWLIGNLTVDVNEVVRIVDLGPPFTVAFEGNLRGAKGDKGDKGDDSTVPGPTGPGARIELITTEEWEEMIEDPSKAADDIVYATEWVIKYPSNYVPPEPPEDLPDTQPIEP